MAKIAWLGAGMVGSGFVEALRRRGEHVVVWNRTFSKAKALEQFGAVAYDDPREAVRAASHVHMILSDDAAVDDVLDRITDALPAKVPVIDHTTVAPEPTARRFAKCAERGIEFLHAPVFMGPLAALDAKGLMLCSGPAERFARVEPELKKMTGELWYLGERVDKAATLKLFGNAMLLVIAAGLADGYAMAKNAGVSANDAYELFSHFKPGIAFEMRGKAMAVRNFAPGFELTMARKDARLMLETAGGNGNLAVLPAIAARMDELIAAGHGSEDLAVLGVDSV